MSSKKFHSGGFVFAEFAIALPLLIFIMYGLATVSIKIFQQSKSQIADYILESEAQYVMEQITQEARVAKEIKITEYLGEENFNEIEILYHTGGTVPDKDKKNYPFYVADIWETRYFIPHIKDEVYVNINAKRQRELEAHPITGSIPADKPNFVPFGDTKITRFKFDKRGKILHVSLEMESVDTGKKIRLNTAVFMPACEN